MGRGTGVRLRTWLALLAVFVGGVALWAYGASWAFVRVAGFFVEGSLRGVPDRVVSREQMELCSGDVVVVGEDLEVVVE